MKQASISLPLALALALGAAAASAHVTLEYQVAVAGTSYKAAFRIGHGCGESATRQVVVDIPAGVRGAHPMPKPGWRVDLERGADVVRVTWTAKSREDVLPSAHYDEFVLVAQMPAQPGTLYWPVRQVCEEGRADWTEVPQAGQKFSDLKSPAALLEVLPGAGGGHAH
ncbi:MAG: hypothetical protein JWP22_782 [Ramlibacter sp.]|jgi:uncharacterized protein YcnI|nr:hypothetical protein [Ramlibacter sp.]MDB5912107.1 hypothetical protein [Ramlibacter sp.]